MQPARLTHKFAESQISRLLINHNKKGKGQIQLSFKSCYSIKAPN